MKKLLIVFMLIVATFIATKTFATDEMLFDSTDKYIGACQLTDISEWTIPEDYYVTNFQIWYKWNEGESTLPVTVFQDGKEFASFTATRTTCDTYQKNWCNADFALNETMPAGKYSTKIATKQQCLEPGKTGTVRLYGTKSDDSNITRNSNNQVPSSRKSDFNRNWLYVIGGFVILGGIIYFVVRKK